MVVTTTKYVPARSLTSSVLGEGSGTPVSSLKGDQGPQHAFCHPSDWGAALTLSKFHL